MRPLLLTAPLQWAFYLGILVFCLSILSQAATLSMLSGNASGQGLHVFSVSGENITAFWNGTAWNVTGVM